MCECRLRVYLAEIDGRRTLNKVLVKIQQVLAFCVEVLCVVWHRCKTCRAGVEAFEIGIVHHCGGLKREKEILTSFRKLGEI